MADTEDQPTERRSAERQLQDALETAQRLVYARTKGRAQDEAPPAIGSRYPDATLTPQTSGARIVNPISSWVVTGLSGLTLLSILGGAFTAGIWKGTFDDQLKNITDKQNQILEEQKETRQKIEAIQNLVYEMKGAASAPKPKATERGAGKPLAKLPLLKLIPDSGTASNH